MEKTEFKKQIKSIENILSLLWYEANNLSRVNTIRLDLLKKRVDKLYQELPENKKRFKLKDYEKVN